MPSTVIARFDYNADAHVLTVEFVSGLIYRYLDVPPEVYTNMRASSAKGIFLNRKIKGHYRFEKLTSFPAPRV